MSSNTGLLRQLARLYGVQTAYYDIDDRRQQAPVEALLAMLRALGAPIDSLRDVPQALRERRQALWRRPLEPVIVAWDGGPASLEVRLPQSLDSPLIGHLALEDGNRQRYEWRVSDAPVARAEEVEGIRYVVKRLTIRDTLPPGYHRLIVQAPGTAMDALIISAPTRAYSGQDERRKTKDQERRTEANRRAWGVFLPLYSLHSQRSWGGGDFSDLEALTDWAAGMGGGVVATLPLLAAFLDEPFDPSPYAPASRLLWNEFYLDVGRLPEMERCPSAKAIVSSQSFQGELAELRRLPLVDYRRQMALKRRVLEELCRCCFAESPGRAEELMRFVVAHPIVGDYAAFRSAGERLRTPWRSWPAPMRDGVLRDGDYAEESKRYHLYVQWAAHQQVEALSKRARETGLGLYLDLPVGVHPDSYDVWRNQGLFMLGTHVGAPPDPLFELGQDWEFPALHPERLREGGYSYYIDYLRHHLRGAGVLRIDHVMGMHRLYLIPEGQDARHGVYLRYRDEEMYAILTLESNRQRCWVVGENLGTVPSYVNSAMSRHGLGRMYVARFRTTPDPDKALQPVPANAVASFNTHDMPPFAAFWQGLDIHAKQEMGIITSAQAEAEMESLEVTRAALTEFLRRKGWLKGDAAIEAVHAACMSYLSASPARLVLVNLEDLWQETQPQNVPGTSQERPNWRRRARHSFEEFSRMPEVVNLLREIGRLRAKGRSDKEVRP
jgi:4-alpha-glucanotransferase